MNPKNSPSGIETNNEISRKITRAQNLDDCEIIITQTKLENILLKFSHALTAGSDWKTPLSLIVAVVIVFLTAEFKKSFIGIGSEVWQALFILVFILSLCWLGRSFYRKYKNRNLTIDALIAKIKNKK